jgi:hypothetical protein
MDFHYCGPMDCCYLSRESLADARRADAIAAAWAVGSGTLRSGHCGGAIGEGWLTAVPFPFKGLGGPTH